MSSGYKWKPLQRGEALPPSRALVRIYMDTYACDEAEARRRLDEDELGVEVWINDLYQVQVRRGPEEHSVHLNIRRRDGYPGRDWRHFQEIKNQLVGPECEAIELYPAESRLVDEANKYHLWACSDPTFRFAVGWSKRRITFDRSNEPGLRQRPPMQRARRPS